MNLDIDDLPLPRSWPEHIRLALVHAVSLANVVMTSALARLATSKSAKTRAEGALQRARLQIAALEEELRIKDARMAKLAAKRRPHYGPLDRLAILELRAARGWTVAKTARRFLVGPATISGWMKRIDEGGTRALVQTVEPVNKFPDFAAVVVQRLKILFPSLGKKRIAQVLARAGLHLGVTTVGRMLKERDRSTASGQQVDGSSAKAVASAKARGCKTTPVIANYAHHVWQIDLTWVEILSGCWTAWWPFSALPKWPFCWCLAVIIDQYSRRVVGFEVFRDSPSAEQVGTVVDAAVATTEQAPRYLICDLGSAFTSDELARTCDAHDILPRFTTKESIRAKAIIERFFLSLKSEWLRRIRVSWRREDFLEQLRTYLSWYHDHRPHQGLGGRTPLEVYEARQPANQRPRFEPRERWPPRSGCAAPVVAKKRHRPEAKLELKTHTADGSILPIVDLKRAA